MGVYKHYIAAIKYNMQYGNMLTSKNNKAYVTYQQLSNATTVAVLKRVNY